MSWHAWFTLATILVMIVALVREWARVDLTLLTTLGVLLVAGIVTPGEAFSGFSDPAVITIASLYVVAAGIHRTGVLTWVDRIFVKTGGTVTSLLVRIMAPTALMSAFLNNTPVVAMLMPRMREIARYTGVPVSRLLMPLSFAAIVGGMITLIGTSTNLIASGLVRDAGLDGFELFEFAWIGLPAAAFAVLYLSTIGHRLMPDTRSDEQEAASAPDYRFELRVPDTSSLVGMSIQDAHLRSLGDAYLVHIRRDGLTLGLITPDMILRGEDILTFSGRDEAMERLLRQTDLVTNPEPPSPPAGNPDIPLFQAVVSANSTLAGKTLKEIGFPEKHHGVVLVIRRRNESIRGALGNVRLRPGDLLIIEAQKGFDRYWNQSQGDFYLVTSEPPIRERRGHKAPLALIILASMIGLHVLNALPLSAAAFAAALCTIFTGCLTGAELRKSIDVAVMLTIAAAFGIGHAVQASGLAAVVGHGIASTIPGQSSLVVLLLLYIVTVVVTEIITNSAAVVIMIPIAVATAVDLGLDPHAVALTVTIAASASFLSPLGYQTNLMVMGAGGYRFRDYFRAGLPVSIGIMIIAVGVVYLRSF